MFDAEITARLREILNEVCVGLSVYETATRTHVASRLLQAATGGTVCEDSLKRIGQDALRDAPTMWR